MTRQTDRRSQNRRRGERRTKNRDRRKGDHTSTGRLALMCLVAMMGLGIFVLFGTNIGSNSGWFKTFLAKEKNQELFSLGKVNFGMSSDLVRQQHPNLILTSLGSRESVAAFHFEGGNYTIWFAIIEGRDQAYRMRYDQIFATRTDNEIIDTIGEKHGKPGTSTCSKSSKSTRRCHFQWWPSGGISLNVSTSQILFPADKKRAALSIITIDTYLDGKRLRMKNRAIAGTRKKKLKKSSEKLPF